MTEQIPLKVYYLALAEGIKFLDYKIIDVHRATTYQIGKGFQDLRRAVSETTNDENSPVQTVFSLASKLEKILNIRTDVFESIFKENSLEEYKKMI